VDGADELEKVYRQEATRIRAALAARLGDVGLAEELVQDAFIEALEHWRNRAVATRFAIGPQAALAEVEPLTVDLDGYRLFHAVRAELLTDLGRHDQARLANERALALAANPAERELLARRLSL
jgi:predicted RNA polymerase sigma factor